MTHLTRVHRIASLAFLFAAAAGPVGGAPPAKSSIVQYEVQLTVPGQPSRKMDQKIWTKGDNFRVEMSMPMGNQPGKQLTVGNSKGVFLLATGMKEAMRLPDSARPKGNVSAMMFGDIAMIKKQKRIGTEKIGRYQTEIFEATQAVPVPGGASGQKSTTRIWVDKKLPVPVKIVTSLPPSFKSTAVLKSIQLNPAISDQMFQLPKGTKVRDSTAPPAGAPPPGRRP